MRLDFLIRGSKATLKGWTSSKLITKYIREYKSHWVAYLKETKTKQLSFDIDARERLLSVFPDDQVLKDAHLIKGNRAVQLYTKFLKYADGDRLYPNYNMLGAASGRFTASLPEFQNLTSKPRNYGGDDPQDNNVRDTLLGAENVFEIDFANQGGREQARLTREPAMIKAFLDGKDPIGEVKRTLGIDRRQAKAVCYGIPYGSGPTRLSTSLGISFSKAQELYNNYWNKYPRVKEYINKLSYLDNVKLHY